MTTPDAYVLDGMRAALLVARVGRQKRQALRQRVAELLAVAMICEQRRASDLDELETRHKLEMLSTYAATCRSVLDPA